MNISLKWYCCIIFSFVLVTAMDAQVNPVYKEIQKNRKLITKGRRKIKQDLTIIEPFVDLGYDDSTLARLKAVGADIEKLYELNQSDWNSKVRAALSDCIIFATVTKKEYPLMPLQSKIQFLTIAHLDVEEFLRNDYQVRSSDIQVMIHSGPSPNGYTTVIGEDTLIVGERYLLFLSAHGFLNEVEYNSSKIIYQKLVNDSTVRFKIINDIAGEYRIRNDSIFNKVSSRNLQETKDEIRTIVNAVSPKKR